MRTSLLALAIAVGLVIAATALFTSADDPRSGKPTLLDGGAMSFDATVLSFDATPIVVTVYRPADASAEAPVPVVLQSHGWAGTRTADGTGIVGRLWDEGFGVVSIDARGHGESGGNAMVHHKDWEVKDFQAVLDWIHDNLDWVQKEPATGIPKDIVAGGAGYSYGGAFQLMTASYDDRLDALAPEITWNDLPYALAPDGIAKSVWIDFLYGTAKESGTRIDPRIDEWYQRILTENEVPAEAMEHFRGASPIPENIQADVLLIQGVPDVLFNLNQALRSYQALEAAGHGDIRLFTHLTGHVAPYAQPFGTSMERRNIFLDEGPCGTLSDLVTAWMDEKLRAGQSSGIPEVSWALDDGSCIVADSLPTDALTGSATLATLTYGAGTTLVPIAQGPAILAGTPILTATVDPLGVAGYGFVGLVILGADGFTRVVDDQTTPFHVEPGADLTLELAGIAARLGPNDQLLLRLDGANEWHAHNGARAPGAAVLHDVQVTIPRVA